MTRSCPWPVALVLVGLLTLAGCGGNNNNGVSGDQPAIGRKGSEQHAAQQLGFPDFATKNTTRVGGADAVADAAGVAQAVYFGGSTADRPPVVALVNGKNWQAGVAAAVFMSAPLHAPELLTSGDSLPGSTSNALKAMGPTGSKAAKGAQVIRVDNQAKVDVFKTTDVNGKDPYTLAAAIDSVQAAVSGHPSDTVVVASGEKPEFAMPAAGWAAKSGNPVLFVKKDSIPTQTRKALAFNQQPKIYVLGPSDVISKKVVTQLRKLGTVKRVAGKDAVTNSVAFARYVDGAFGWGVVDPGHGLVFASTKRPLDAAAAAPLSASGTYGPLVLVDRSDRLPPGVIQYLLDIEPGYQRDPVRGVYNHGWLMGDTGAISTDAQSQIDRLLEIAPVQQGKPPQP